MKYEKPISIGEAAKLSGISVRRVRYLSDQGYIQEPIKWASGAVCYRWYTREHIEHIKRIKAYQDEGYTLATAAKNQRR